MVCPLIVKFLLCSLMLVSGCVFFIFFLQSVLVTKNCTTGNLTSSTENDSGMGTDYPRQELLVSVGEII